MKRKENNFEIKLSKKRKRKRRKTLFLFQSNVRWSSKSEIYQLALLSFKRLVIFRRHQEIPNKEMSSEEILYKEIQKDTLAESKIDFERVQSLEKIQISYLLIWPNSTFGISSFGVFLDRRHKSFLFPFFVKKTIVQISLKAFFPDRNKKKWIEKNLCLKVNSFLKNKLFEHWTWLQFQIDFTFSYKFECPSPINWTWEC